MDTVDALSLLKQMDRRLCIPIGRHLRDVLLSEKKKKTTKHRTVGLICYLWQEKMHTMQAYMVADA